MAGLLITHIIVGLSGAIASYITLMGLLRNKVSVPMITKTSFFAVVAYITTWITGGIYYLNVYGVTVKPLIKAGEYPWAHSFFMETKEHLFLFLPIIALVVWLAIISSGSLLEKNDSLRRAVMLLAALSFALAVAMALFGVVISGAK